MEDSTVELNGTQNCGSEETVEGLQTCVSDLLEHNMVLCTTVAELETETRKRIEAIETFLERTAPCVKAYMVGLNDYESFVRRLIKNKMVSFDQIKKLQEKCVELAEEKWCLQDQNNNLNHDISSLLRLITHARNTGQWDIGNIEFCHVSLEDVFGSVDRFSNRMFQKEGSQCESQSRLSSVCSVVDDYGISKLFGEHQTLTCNLSDLQSPRSGRVTGQDALIHRLQIHCKQNQQVINEIQMQLTQRDQTIADLQLEIANLRQEMYVKNTEHYQYRQLLLQKDFYKADERFCLSEKENQHVDLETELQLLEHSNEFCDKDNYCLAKTCDTLRQLKMVDDKLESVVPLAADENQIYLEKLNRLRKCDACGAVQQLGSSEFIDNQWNENHLVVSQTAAKQFTDLSNGNQTENKVDELEMVILKLQEDLDDRNKNEFELREELAKTKLSEEKLHEEVKQLSSKVSELEQIVDRQKCEIQTSLNVITRKSRELEQQQVTINNLQDAVVSLKSQTTYCKTQKENGNLSTGFKNSSSNSLTQGKSGEIFHI